MVSKTVIKPDMAMLRQEQLGLSPFGLLSRLFQEELERRVQQNLGAYAPVPMTLLEEPDQETAAQPVPVSLHLDVHVEAPKLREEKAKTDPKREWDKPVEMRILERVQLRERELRETRQILHRLELRLDGQRWNLPQVSRQTEQTAARRHEVGRSTAGTPLPLASQAAAAPGTGGWLPRHQQTHPGYPTQETRQEGPTGASILLPDVLRRRREAALAQTEDISSGWSGTPGERRLEGNPTEELLHFVHQAVEQTIRQNHSREQAARQLAEQAASVHGSPAESGWKQRQSDREPAMRQPVPAVETPRPGRPEGGRNPVFVSNDRTEDAERLAPASDRTSAGSIPAAGGAVQTADQEAGMAAVPAERIHAAGPDGMLSQNGSEELIYRQMPEVPETAVPASKRNIPAESNFRREAGGQPTKPEQSAGPNNVPFAAGTSVSASSTPAAAHWDTGRTAAPSDGPANTMPAATSKEHRRVQGRMDGEPPTAPMQTAAEQTAEHDRSLVQTEQRQWESEARNDSKSLSDGTGPVSKPTARPTESMETTSPEEPMVHRTVENAPITTAASPTAVQPVPEERSERTERSDTVRIAYPTESTKTTQPEETAAYREIDVPSAAVTARPVEPVETAPAEEPMVYRTMENAPMTTAASPTAVQPVSTERSEHTGSSDVVNTARPAESTKTMLPEEAIVHRETVIPNEREIARSVAATETTPPKEPMVHREGDVPGAAVTARPAESAETTPAGEPMVHRTVENAPGTTSASPTAAQSVSAERSEHTGSSDVVNTARPAESTKTTLPEEAIVHRETVIPNAREIVRGAETAEITSPKEPMIHREGDVPSAAATARPVEPAETAPAEEPMVHRTVENALGTTASSPTAVQPVSAERSEHTGSSDVVNTARPAESMKTTLPEEAIVHRETVIPNEREIARSVAATETTPPKEPMVHREGDVPGAAVTARPAEPAETTPAGEPMVHRTMENASITMAASPTAAQSVSAERSEHTKRSDVVRTARPAEHAPTAQPEEPIVYRETDAPNQSDTAHPAAATGAAPSGQPVIQRATNGSDAASKATPMRNRLTAARPVRHAAGSPAEPDVPLVLRQNDGTETPAAEPFNVAALRDIRTARPTAGQTAAAEMAWRSGTPALTFAKTARQQPPEPPEKKTDATQNLPAWARELLEKPPAQTAGAAPSGQNRQIQWTAPQAVPVPAARTSPPANAAAVPPSLLHRERGGDDERSSAAQQVEREAEIRRTADKVYRIIEERLRRELRRSGR